jgi:ABC-2 type transport system ATP-binding protein
MHIEDSAKKLKTLSVSGLRKQYGSVVAVDGVSFDLECNSIVGLLGPNGAGKTTIINMILGVLEPDEGSIRVEGFDIALRRSQAAERMNFAAVYAPLPGNLTVSQNLDAFRDKRCGVLSSGEQTRVSLAKAMINRPRLLLLDEPTASLDPATAREIRAEIRKFAMEGASGVLWASHNMYEVQEICDRVMFLSHGKIMLEGDPKTLPEQHGKKTLEELFITVAREPLTLEVG